jgi:sortase A
MIKHDFSRLVIAGLFAVGIWQLSTAGVIQAKAWVAPKLIERAWQRTLDEHRPVKPWPWADTWPVAHLAVPAMDIERYVLAGAHGSSLPFGPGHMDGSALPGEPGSVIIAGHRDTHFGFLHEIRPGAILQLTSMRGHRFDFEITGQEIVDARLHGISPLSTGSELILVTCQPTKGMPFRGPYRLVVTAKPIKGFRVMK